MCARTHFLDSAVEVRVAKFESLSISELESLHYTMIGEHSKII